jgi:hypothetical protein
MGTNSEKFTEGNEGSEGRDSWSEKKGFTEEATENGAPEIENETKENEGNQGGAQKKRTSFSLLSSVQNLEASDFTQKETKVAKGIKQTELPESLFPLLSFVETAFHLRFLRTADYPFLISLPRNASTF